MKALLLQNRTIALIENGSWAKMSGKLIRANIESMKNMTILDATFSIASAMKREQTEELDIFVENIITSMK
jgi:flavorubredoxin